MMETMRERIDSITSAASWHVGIMARQDDRELRDELARLRVEHRSLDQEIIELETMRPGDQLNISRLKRRKLKLKDQIAKIEDQLFPDIIA